jgi:hypothetical protein
MWKFGERELIERREARTALISERPHEYELLWIVLSEPVFDVLLKMFY